MVPKDVDICVCTDIDERLGSGWREKLEKVWTDGVTKVEYTDVRYLNKDGSYGGIQNELKFMQEIIINGCTLFMNVLRLFLMKKLQLQKK